MGLKEGESFLDYRKRVLDSVSSSFCAAKWLNATIWLNSGKTASCHHPPSHDIEASVLKEDPSALHNTQHKISMRKLMLQGQRPPECEYCWKIEDLSSTHVSDRVFKSFIFNDSEIERIAKQSHTESVNPKYLEIAFDRSCNFACSYCNPAFSTRWVQDIKQNGPYAGLDTDDRNHYIHTHDYSEKHEMEENPYIQAFWQWWPSLAKDLKVLRVTGGEPLMSPHFWKLLDRIGEGAKLNQYELAINSNLGASDLLIQKFIDKAKAVPHLEVFTSNESHGAYSEYIRDGIVYHKWLYNLELLKSSGAVKRTHCMLTISGLALFSIVDFLNDMLAIKEKYGAENPTLNFSILRFPTFQSPLVLPEFILLPLAEDLEAWYAKNKTSNLLLDFERDHISRLINYLQKAKEATQGAAKQEELQKNLKRFMQQYDVRRKKDYKKVFPKVFVDWMDTIDV